MKEFEKILRENRAAALKNRTDSLVFSEKKPRLSLHKTAAPAIAPAIKTKQTARNAPAFSQNRETAALDLDGLSKRLERDCRRYPRAFSKENEGEEG